MPRHREPRITTEDPRSVKRQRVEKALKSPATRDLPSRTLARILGVDESMVRRHRAKLAPVKKPKVKKKTKPAAKKKPAAVKKQK